MCHVIQLIFNQFENKNVVIRIILIKIRDTSAPEALLDVYTTSRDRPKSAPYPRLKNSKRTSKSQFTVLENRKSKKMDPVARRGPLARAPGALKGGLSNLSTFLSQLKGDPLEKKQVFEKKSHNAEKLKGGTLWSRPVWHVTRKNRKNLFGSVR